MAPATGSVRYEFATGTRRGKPLLIELVRRVVTEQEQVPA